MADAILNSVARKFALDRARQAVRSRSLSELRAALEALPTDGMKAAQLRVSIKDLLNEEATRSEPDDDIRESFSTFVSDGIGYRFRCLETGETAFFRVRQEGALLYVDLNSDHPFTSMLIDQELLSHPVILSLLASWAHYELEQHGYTAKGHASDARTDWSRHLQRLIRVSPEFNGQ